MSLPSVETTDEITDELEFSSALVSEIEKIRQSEPWKAITILCGSHARDDVMSILADSGPWLNIEVLPLSMFIDQAQRTLSPRVLLDRKKILQEVRHLLAEDAPERTEFHNIGVNTQTMTQSSLADSIYLLSQLPENRRSSYQPEEQLPCIVADLAQEIFSAQEGEFFTYAEAVDAAVDHSTDRHIIIAGDIAFDTLSEDLLNRLPNKVQLAYKRKELPSVELNSFITEKDEADYIASRILTAVGEGTELYKIAVGYCDTSSIPFLVQSLQQAGIPCAAPKMRRWTEDSYARAWSLLLSLDPVMMPRRELADLLATGVLNSAPASDLEEGQAPYLGFFDSITRRDNTFSAGSDWDNYDCDKAHISEDKREKDTGKVVSWVRSLRKQLDYLWSSTSYPEFIEKLAMIRDKNFRPARGIEGAFWSPLVETLSSLMGEPSQPQVVDAVWLALQGSYDSVLPEKKGLLRIDSIEALAGRELDLVFIAGATDAALPGSITAMPTLTHQQRGTESEIFLARRERAVQAALNTAPTVVVSYPRSYLNGSGKAQPSLWLFQEEKFGKILEETPFYSLHESVFTGALAPSRDIQITIADILDKAASGEEIPAEYKYYGDILHARTRGSYGQEEGSQYNGYIRGEVIAPLVDKFLSKPLSNTALEAFTAIPLVFLIERMTGNYLLEDRDNSHSIDSRDKGLLYHEIFEKWTEEVWFSLPVESRSYENIDWDHAHGVLEKYKKEILEKTHTGEFNTLMWSLFERDCAEIVEQWFIQEKADAEEGWIPVGTELSFGYSENNEPPFEMDMPDGRTLQFRGSIDRLDMKVNRDEEGIASVHFQVTDYKSGKGDFYQLKQAHPTKVGKSEKESHKFQLALYGETIRSAIGRGKERIDTQGWYSFWKQIPPEVKEVLLTGDKGNSITVEVLSRYWFFTQLGGNDTSNVVEIMMNDEVADIIRNNIEHIYGFITGGVFPPHSIDDRSFNKKYSVRLSQANYDSLTEALTDRGAIPLQFESKSTGIA